MHACLLELAWLLDKTISNNELAVFFSPHIMQQSVTKSEAANCRSAENESFVWITRVKFKRGWISTFSRLVATSIRLISMSMGRMLSFFPPPSSHLRHDAVLHGNKSLNESRWHYAQISLSLFLLLYDKTKEEEKKNY